MNIRIVGDLAEPGLTHCPSVLCPIIPYVWLPSGWTAEAFCLGGEDGDGILYSSASHTAREGMAPLRQQRPETMEDHGCPIVFTLYPVDKVSRWAHMDGRFVPRRPL